MAVAFDAAASNGPSGTVDSITQSLTISGSDRLLLAGVHQVDNSATLNEVAWGGTGGTALTEYTGSPFTSGASEVHVFYLLSPATGTDDVYVEQSGFDQLGLSVISLTGVDQSTPFGTEATGTGATNLSAAVSAAVDDMVVDFFTSARSDKVFSAGAGQTARANIDFASAFGGTSDNSGNLGASTEPGAASVTMSWSHDSGPSGGNGILVAIPVLQASGGGATPTAAGTPERSYPSGIGRGIKRGVA